MRMSAERVGGALPPPVALFVCGGRGAAGVCGGRMALRGVRLPNGAAVCDATVGAPTVASADAM